MKEKCVVSERDRELLAYNGLDSFESLWNVELDWFESPNYRRSGWSGVSRHVLRSPAGGGCAVFIKRQQNHNYRSLSHPIEGRPTMYREYRNICRMKAHGIPCPELVFYGHRSGPGRQQAILITRSLEGYAPLEDCLASLDKDDTTARRALLDSVAHTVRRMHGHYLRHSCLHAKHVLVKAEREGNSNHPEMWTFDSAVIDLEKMRAGFPWLRLAVHDLDQLCRHWERQEGDWEAFIGSYVRRMKFRFLGRILRRAVIRKAMGKLSRRSLTPSVSGPGVGENETAHYPQRPSLSAASPLTSALDHHILPGLTEPCGRETSRLVRERACRG